MVTEQDIERELVDIERTEEVRIVYACESGSRAWGFASTDSDYDVRFIFVRRRDWYLSIRTRRDVIERPIDEVLDVSGWDLPKALLLYRKSNPPLYEWLGSPIVYRDDFGLAARLREMKDDYYLRKAAVYHYARMAENNWRSHLQRDEISLKKYFYALRPLFAVMWLERRLGVVPTKFATLVDTIVEEQHVLDAIAELIERKAAGTEVLKGPPVPALHEYLATHMERVEQIADDVEPDPRGHFDTLDDVFRACLDAAWANDA